MPWRPEEPGHQQEWYWTNTSEYSFSSTRRINIVIQTDCHVFSAKQLRQIIFFLILSTLVLEQAPCLNSSPAPTPALSPQSTKKYSPHLSDMWKIGKANHSTILRNLISENSLVCIGVITLLDIPQVISKFDFVSSLIVIDDEWNLY